MSIRPLFLEVDQRFHPSPLSNHPGLAFALQVRCLILLAIAEGGSFEMMRLRSQGDLSFTWPSGKHLARLIPSTSLEGDV